MRAVQLTSTNTKAEQVALKALVILLFVWMMAIGIFKLIGKEPALVETFKAMHYLKLMPFIGLLEIAGGIGLLVPRFRIYAAVGLLFIFFGGLASHLASATYFPMVPMSVTALLMVLCVIKLDGRLKI